MELNRENQEFDGGGFNLNGAESRKLGVWVTFNICQLLNASVLTRPQEL